MSKMNHSPINHRQPVGKLALLMDFENLVMGLENSEPGCERPFVINTVIQYLEQQHGAVLVRKAFADWSNAKYRKYALELARAGVEMQHVVRLGLNGKSATDTCLVIQSLECLTQYPDIDTFVLGSGDGDFLPLVMKLKACGRKIVGLGAQGTAASVLVENCDEFLSYTPKGALVPRPRATADIAPIRQILENALDSDGALPVRRIYGILKEQIPNFLPRNYGFNNIFDMLRQIPTLTLFVREDGEERVRLVSDTTSEDAAPQADSAPAAVAHEKHAPSSPSRTHTEPVTRDVTTDCHSMQSDADTDRGDLEEDEEDDVMGDDPSAMPERFSDYMTSTRWFIHAARMRRDILNGIFQHLKSRSSSVTLDELRQHVDPSISVTDKEWFGTLFSLIHGGCLWEDPNTSEKPLAQRAVSLFRGVHDMDEFVARYYCSLFHKASVERHDISSAACAQLMYNDTATEHVNLFELVLRRLKNLPRNG